MRKEGKLNINLNGSLSDRRSKRELDSLLFTINDYIGLKEQLQQGGIRCLKDNNIYVLKIGK